jgi:hypothetical protein
VNGLERRRVANAVPGLISLHDLDGPDDRDDDADGETPCCMAGAMHGPRGCTCWEPVHDLGQADPVVGANATRPRCCGDCAYRNDSPERAGDDPYDDELRDIAGTPGHVFACHDGMRKRVAWAHPDGRRVEVEGDDYDPPIVDGVAYKADGTPADLCAGWAACRAGLLA